MKTYRLHRNGTVLKIHPVEIPMEIVSVDLSDERGLGGAYHLVAKVRYELQPEFVRTQEIPLSDEQYDQLKRAEELKGEGGKLELEFIVNVAFVPGGCLEDEE